MSIRLVRALVVVVILAAAMIGCDGNEEIATVTVNVTVEGNGTGRIESQTIGFEIRCNVNNGTTSGTCMRTLDVDGGGILRLVASPDDVTNFSWGGDCRSAVGRTCELTFAAGDDAVFNVVGRFNVKTVQILITPRPVIIRALGAEGAVVATAQAIDDGGAEVFGVSYTWESSDPGAVAVTPQANNRSAVIEALNTSGAIVLVTAQGVTGQVEVNVVLTN